ncbi:MAG: AAA family ATPase [Anaerolineae bacterium]
MIHLRTVTQVTATSRNRDTFPYNVPIIRSLETLEFTTPITFLVGDNGSGKSTLLEAIAVASNIPTVGSLEAEQDHTLKSIRDYANKGLKLAWSKKTRRGFFMRSEDFFGYIKRQAQIREELHTELREMDDTFKGMSDYARTMARMPYMREIKALEEEYGGDLDAHSHGESYFTLFQARFIPDGLYLLDEPEAPLSPMRQLAMLNLLKEMVAHNAQFIIATHSPILMAYPGATILSFDGGSIRPIAYDQLEHVIITRDFLNNPAAYIHHLMG